MICCLIGGGRFWSSGQRLWARLEGRTVAAGLVEGWKAKKAVLLFILQILQLCGSKANKLGHSYLRA